MECINKADRQNPHERILEVGGRNPNGTRWLLSQAEAISGIKSGKWCFYVQLGRLPPVDVVVARSRYGHEYLRTASDSEFSNNLLALSECPIG